MKGICIASGQVYCKFKVHIYVACWSVAVGWRLVYLPACHRSKDFALNSLLSTPVQSTFFFFASAISVSFLFYEDEVKSQDFVPFTLLIWRGIYSLTPSLYSTYNFHLYFLLCLSFVYHLAGKTNKHFVLAGFNVAGGVILKNKI